MKIQDFSLLIKGETNGKVFRQAKIYLSWKKTRELYGEEKEKLPKKLYGSR